MNAKRWVGSVTLAAGLLATLAAPSAAQHGYPELGREQELRLAMSAGPLTISRHADVYLMGDRGFERAIQGTNGFTCLVVRVAADRKQLAPHCLNPAATQSVLPAMLLEGELQARGLDAEAIDAELERRWANGELRLPSGPASAYMLSEGQVLGASGGNFHPHFMVYHPYITNADIGGDPGDMSRPFVGPYEGHPLSTIVIIMETFVSPSSVVIPVEWPATDEAMTFERCPPFIGYRPLVAP